MLGLTSVVLRAAGCAFPKPLSEPLSLWKFDETGGPSFADSGPANVPMAIVGTWADLATGSMVQGIGGTSAYTDGSGYATIPANDPDHNLSELTTSFYYQRNSAAAKHILLAAGNGTQVGDFSIEVLANGRLRGWHVGQDAVLRFFESTSGITGTNLEVGTAHRIDLTLGSLGARIYLDGVLLISGSIVANTNGWNNARVKYLGVFTDGVSAPAHGAFDGCRIWDQQLTGYQIATLEPAQSVTLPSLPSSGFDCIENGGGTLVDLGDFDNRETTINLTAGGNARYDASGIISRTRWLGAQGCSTPNRHSTTEQFLFRFTGSHNGGCISGGAIYGNLTPHEDYDPGSNDTDPGNFALYPCSDGAQIYVRGSNLQNFSIEGWRFHGCWDPVRIARTGSEVADHITIKGSWFTCIRDDVVENDSYVDEVLFTDNLVGDVIGSGPTNSGCFRFFSMAGGSSDHTAKRARITNNLIWSSQFKASNRARGINGYAVGTTLKVAQNNCPRMVFTNNVFMVDALAFGGCSGDPLCTLTQAIAGGGSSSGNILIWRDLGNIGSYPFSLPAGFTLLTGSEGESFWNERVNAWKAAHPNVRRFNKTGIARPFGGAFNLIDTG